MKTEENDYKKMILIFVKAKIQHFTLIKVDTHSVIKSISDFKSLIYQLFLKYRNMHRLSVLLPVSCHLAQLYF